MNSKLFLREKPSDILIYLNNKGYNPKSNFKVNCPYHYLLKILKSFEVCGFITQERTGRNKIVEVTEKGKLLAGHLKRIKRLID